MKRSYTFKCVSNLAPYSHVNKRKQSFQRTATRKNLCSV